MKRPPSHRALRVANLIRQTLSDLVRTRVRDPRVGRATITRVEVTADLSLATVWVSVAGEDAEREDALTGLRSARGFLRSEVARRIDVRTVPDLRFRLDRGLDHARQIDELLARVRPDRETS